MRSLARLVPALLLWACAPVPQAPAVPSNFAALFWPDNVLLSWDPVNSATGYEVYALLPPVVWKRLPTTQAHLSLSYGNAFLGRSDLAFAVRAISPHRTSALTAEIGKPAYIAQAGITVTGTTATVEWPSSYGVATIALGTSPDALTEVVQDGMSPWRRAGLEPGRAYYWKVIFGSPPIFFRTYSFTHVAPLPPAAQVSYSGEQFTLSWPPVVGADRYRVRATSGGSITTTDISGTSFGPTACTGTATCSFELATISDTYSVSSYSAPFQVSNPPAVPPAPAVRRGVNKVVVSLTTLPSFADHLKVLRGDNPALPMSEVGSTTSGGATFTDTTAQPWQGHFYAVKAVTSDGVESLVSPPSGLVFATDAPVAMALGGTGTETDLAEGERFQVSSGGRLMGIEVGLTSPQGWVLLELSAGGRPFRRNNASVQPASALVPDAITGTYFDFSPAGVPVSAGELLQFDIVGDGSVTAGMGAATSGGHFRHGSPDAAHDLAYKLFIVPDATFTAPPAVQQTPGVQAVRLDWGAVPGAIRYEVYRREDASGTSFGLLGSTNQRWYLDQGVQPGGWQWFYEIHAVAANGTAAVSSGGYALNALSELVEAESLGTSGGASIQLCIPGATKPGGVTQLDQTFSVTQSGTLVALEAQVESPLSIDPASPIDLPVSLRFEVLDANGVSLGSQTAQESPHLPGPLMPFVRNGGAYILPLGIAAVVGQILTLRLTHPAGDRVPCLLIRDSADSYSGGHEVRDGVVAPGRNLAFRTTSR
jgi:hypothetical protein